MQPFYIILVLTVSVIGLAFWKDIKVMSARQKKRKKRRANTLQVVSKRTTDNGRRTTDDRPKTHLKIN